MQKAKTCATTRTCAAPPSAAHKNVWVDQTIVLMCVTWCLRARARGRTRPRVLHVHACGWAQISGNPKCCTSKHSSDLPKRFYVRHLGMPRTCGRPHAFLRFAHGHKNLIVTQSHSEPNRATQSHSDSCRVTPEVLKINFYFLPYHQILHCLKAITKYRNACEYLCSFVCMHAHIVHICFGASLMMLLSMVKIWVNLGGEIQVCHTAYDVVAIWKTEKLVGSDIIHLK